MLSLISAILVKSLFPPQINTPTFLSLNILLFNSSADIPIAPAGSTLFHLCYKDLV